MKLANIEEKEVIDKIAKCTEKIRGIIQYNKQELSSLPDNAAQHVRRHMELNEDDIHDAVSEILELVEGLTPKPPKPRGEDILF